MDIALQHFNTKRINWCDRPVNGGISHRDGVRSDGIGKPSWLMSDFDPLRTFHIYLMKMRAAFGTARTRVTMD